MIHQISSLPRCPSSLLNLAATWERSRPNARDPAGPGWTWLEIRGLPSQSLSLRYPGGRTWPEVKHLMGKDMGEMMSGAFDENLAL